MKKKDKKKDDIIINPSFQGWIITLLIIIILIQLLIKFPIEIRIEEANCPEILCKNVDCNCNIEIEVINRTQCVFDIEEIWDGIDDSIIIYPDYEDKKEIIIDPDWYWEKEDLKLEGG